MNKNNNKTIKPPRYGSLLPNKSSRARYGVARFNKVTDPVVTSAFSSPPSIVTVSTDGAGAGAFSFPLSPLGLNAYDIVAKVQATVDAPHLPWLYNTARNFAKYRIVRANVIITGLIGSTSVGNVTCNSTPDYSDTSVNFTSTATGGITFDLASLASKNRVYPLEIDSSWKKITNITSAGSGNNVYTINSINDLIFSCFNLDIKGAAATTNVINLYVEYDVEFSHPIGLGLNG